MNHLFHKLVSTTALILAVLLFTTACGGGKKTVSVDPAKLAKDLVESTVTSEELSELAASMIAGTYYISDDVYASGVAYKGTGATACEVVVIEAKEESQTKDVESKLKEHVASQSDLYASYNAGEVEKLDHAVLKSIGRYTVLCVCDDADQAAKILKDAGF